jgi:hypothetical protein
MTVRTPDGTVLAHGFRDPPLAQGITSQAVGLAWHFNPLERRDYHGRWTSGGSAVSDLPPGSFRRGRSGETIYNIPADYLDDILGGYGDSPQVPADPALTDYVKSTVDEIPKMLGGGHELWNGKVVTQDVIQGQPQAAAALDWEGTMRFRTDVADNIEAGIKGQGNIEPDDLITPLHELIHGNAGPDVTDYETQASAYQNRHAADIEEGFTQLGAIQHFGEYQHSLGMDDKPTHLILPNAGPEVDKALSDVADGLDALAGYMDRPLSDIDPGAATATRKEARAIRQGKELDTTILRYQALGGGADEYAASHPQVQHYLDNLKAAFDALDKAAEGHTANYRQYAEIMADPGRIKDGLSFNSYPDQVRWAYGWVESVAEREQAHGKIGQGPEALRKRILALANQVNTNGPADKTAALAGQVLAMHGMLPHDLDLNSWNLLKRKIRDNWPSGHARGGPADAMAEAEALLDRIHAHPIDRSGATTPRTKYGQTIDSIFGGAGKPGEGTGVIMQAHKDRANDTAVRLNRLSKRQGNHWGVTAWEVLDAYPPNEGESPSAYGYRLDKLNAADIYRKIQDRRSDRMLGRGPGAETSPPPPEPPKPKRRSGREPRPFPGWQIENQHNVKAQAMADRINAEVGAGTVNAKDVVTAVTPNPGESADDYGKRLARMGIYDVLAAVHQMYRKEYGPQFANEIGLAFNPAELRGAHGRWAKGPVFYHGSLHQFQPGDMVDQGHGLHFQQTDPRFVYLTTKPKTAYRYAGAGATAHGHVYEVEPTGDYADDINSAPESQAYRTRKPLRIIREIPMSEAAQMPPSPVVPHSPLYIGKDHIPQISAQQQESQDIGLPYDSFNHTYVLPPDINRDVAEAFLGMTIEQAYRKGLLKSYDPAVNARYHVPAVGTASLSQQLELAAWEHETRNLRGEWTHGANLNVAHGQERHGYEGRFMGYDPLNPPMTPADGRKPLDQPGRPDGAGTPDDPIDPQGNMYRAVDLLIAGKHVRLNGPEELPALANEINRRGDQVGAGVGNNPPWDLGNVSVKGTRLFTEQTTGIPRHDMPQLGGAARPGSEAALLAGGANRFIELTPQFRAQLQRDGVDVKNERVNADQLRATQTGLTATTVSGIARAAMQGNAKVNHMLADPIWVSKDNYIIDGHHRWAAGEVIAAARGNFAGRQIEVRRLNLPIALAVPYALGYAERMGIGTKHVGGQQKLVGAANLTEQAIELGLAHWLTEKRGWHGEWVGGSGIALQALGIKSRKGWIRVPDRRTDEQLPAMLRPHSMNDLRGMTNMLESMGGPRQASLMGHLKGFLSETDAGGGGTESPVPEVVRTFAAAGAARVDRMYGGGHETFNGQVTKGSNLLGGTRQAGALAFLDWDGSMHLRGDVADGLAHEDQGGAIEAGSAVTLLHELTHGVTDRRNRSGDDEMTYRHSRSAADAEEGFTQLGAVFHAREFFEAQGIADKPSGSTGDDGHELTFGELADEGMKRENVLGDPVWDIYADLTKRAYLWAEQVAQQRGVPMSQIVDEINRLGTASKVSYMDRAGVPWQ